MPRGVGGYSRGAHRTGQPPGFQGSGGASAPAPTRGVRGSRGRRGGRGASARHRKDPSHGWTRTNESQGFVYEADALHAVFNEWTQQVSFREMSRIATEIRAKSLEPSRAGHVNFFANDTLALTLTLTWINEYIALHCTDTQAYTLAEMYRSVLHTYQFEC